MGMVANSAGRLAFIAGYFHPETHPAVSPINVLHQQATRGVGWEGFKITSRAFWARAVMLKSVIPWCGEEESDRGRSWNAPRPPKSTPPPTLLTRPSVCLDAVPGGHAPARGTRR